MGILDDIKNPKLLSYKSFTTQDLIKDIKSMKFSGKGNKFVNCDVSVKNDYSSIVITTPNGCKITIDKDNINDFIITDDDISEIIQRLKKEMINKNDKDISTNEGVNKN